MYNMCGGVDTSKVQKRGLDVLKLGFQAVVNCLMQVPGTKLQS